MTCGIYKITNKINRKVYIGQARNIENRWKQHLKVYHNPNYEYYEYPLYRAMRKYKIENFSFDIEKECLKNELNKEERKSILQYECLVPNGYNQNLGGDFANPTNYEELQRAKNIINDLKTTSLSQTAIGEKYGVSQQNVSLINKGQIFYYDNENYPLRKQIVGRGAKKPDNFCPICGTKIIRGSKLCRHCDGLKRRNPMPNKEDLIANLIKLHGNISAVGRIYNVSKTCIYKWLNRYDLNKDDYR